MQPAAEAGAVGMVVVDSVLGDLVAGRTPAEAASVYEPRVEAFCKGDGALDGKAFFGLLEKAQEPAIATAIAEAKSRAHAKFSIPSTGMTATIVDTVLKQVVRHTVKGVIEEKLAKLGLAEAVREFRDEMPMGPLGLPIAESPVGPIRNRQSATIRIPQSAITFACVSPLL